jgi:drug/metabolite transporter (DMT)-like permease
LNPWLALLAAVLCVSFGSIFVRLAEAPALAVSFYRIGLASLFVAPFGLAPALDHWRTLSGRHRAALVGAGAALAIHFATWIASLSYTSIAASVLLVNLAPLFTIVLSWTLLGERPTARTWLAGALALAGAALIAAGDWTGGGTSPLFGDALALAGAAALSVYHVIGRGLRDALPLAAYVQTVWTIAAVVLAVLLLLYGVPFAPYSTRSILAFAALAIVPTIGGHGLVNRSLRVLPAPVVGLFLLGEPIGATILAYLFFGETPTPLTLVGGAIVLAALVLLGTGRAPEEKAEAAA